MIGCYSDQLRVACICRKMRSITRAVGMVQFNVPRY